MDTIRLRTLAWKSIMGFGKYYDLAVLEVYNLQHTRYLRWCYYNCSMISFSTEILESIFIHKKDEIEKPGINKEKGVLLTNRIVANMDDFQALKMKSRYKRKSKARLLKNVKKDSNDNTKSKLQLRNHGH